MLGTFKMVTALAGRVADLAQQNAELQKQVGELSKTVESLSDLDQHLQFREADAAVQRAMSGDPAPAEPPAPRTGSRMRHGSRARDAAAQAVDGAGGADANTPAANPVPPKAPTARYKLQAASPDVAILDSGDNNATSVHVGDTLPGYGTIKTISMRGGNWVVQTEHGVIQ